MSLLKRKLSATKAIELKKVFAHFGVDIQEGASHIKCPFEAHMASGATPSFKFYEETNSFYCWGCKVGGSAVDFVMGMRGCTFNQAIEYLLDTFEIKMESSFIVGVMARLKSRRSNVDNTFTIIQQVLLFNSKRPSLQDRQDFAARLYWFIIESFDGTDR